MSKLYSLHPLVLRPGVKAEEFETFVKEVWPSYTPFPGWKPHILKGDRGDREGKYLVLMEIESVEARNRFYPRPGEPSDELKQFAEAHPESTKILEKFQTLVDGLGVLYTGYVEIV